MNKTLRNTLISFAVLLPVQVLILNYVHLFGFINPYVYLMALLLLPFGLSSSWQYIIAFATGMFVDLFSLTYGVHASASLMMIFLRPFIVRMLDGKKAEDSSNSPMPCVKSFGWIAVYTLMLVFVHHFMVAILEVFSLQNFWRHLYSAVVNTLFTSFCIICLEYIFFPTKNKK